MRIGILTGSQNEQGAGRQSIGCQTPIEFGDVNLSAGISAPLKELIRVRAAILTGVHAQRCVDARVGSATGDVQASNL